MAGTLRMDVRPLRLRLVSPLVTSRGPIGERATWLVRIGTESLVGYGEAAPLPGFGGGDPEEVSQVLAALGNALREFALYGSPGAGRESLLGWRETAHRIAPTAPAARAAVEFALADLLAQIAGVPLSTYLMATARESVEVNGVIGAVPAGEAARRAATLVSAGFGTIKLKVGLGLVADTERVAAVRAAAGEMAEIRLDANGAWSVDEALTALEAFTDLGIELVEQPVAAEDIEALAKVRRLSRIPVAADEALLRVGGPEAVLAAEAADVLVLKPSLLGGPLSTLDLARQAAARGVGCFVTTAIDSAVGRMGALHVAAALPAVGLENSDASRAARDAPISDAWRPKDGSVLGQRAHGLATDELLAEDVGSTPAPIRGSMSVPATPGLGLRDVGGPWEPVTE